MNSRCICYKCDMLAFHQPLTTPFLTRISPSILLSHINHHINLSSHLTQPIHLSLHTSHVSHYVYTFPPHPPQSLGEKRTGKMMSAERCADLFAVALANRLSEVWITAQPVLTLMYCYQYLPTLANRYDMAACFTV